MKRKIKKEVQNIKRYEQGKESGFEANVIKFSLSQEKE